MKATIITDVRINTDAIDELKELIPGIKIEIDKNSQFHLQPKWNPYHLDMWADFDKMRDLFIDKTDIRCFVTSERYLQSIGITSHIGMYDATDSDSVVDFYIGLPENMDDRCVNNGFQYNFVWLFIHEFLHGKELLAKYKDRTHSMEKQSRLKELLAEHLERDKLVEKVGLLTKIKLLLQTILWYTKN